MVVYDIVTPDNLKEPPAWRPDWRQKAFRRSIGPTTLFFWTGEQYGNSFEDDGITIDLAGQRVKQINEDIWLLEPSNIQLKIDFQTLKLKSPLGAPLSPHSQKLKNLSRLCKLSYTHGHLRNKTGSS